MFTNMMEPTLYRIYWRCYLCVLLIFIRTSNASDGTLSPSRLIRQAFDAGLCAVALTDHDTADGLLEAEAAVRDILSQGENVDFQFIPGIELSVSYENYELHLVGLHLDIHSDGFSQTLKKLQDNRDKRNEKNDRLYAGGGHGYYYGSPSCRSGRRCPYPGKFCQLHAS